MTVTSRPITHPSAVPAATSARLCPAQRRGSILQSADETERISSAGGGRRAGIPVFVGSFDVGSSPGARRVDAGWPTGSSVTISLITSAAVRSPAQRPSGGRGGGPEGWRRAHRGDPLGSARRTRRMTLPARISPPLGTGTAGVRVANRKASRCALGEWGGGRRL